MKIILDLLTDANREHVFFHFDRCFYTEDVNGKEIKVNHKLYPATQ
jgi:hypothetical protein